MIDRMARGVTDRGWAWAIVVGVTVINVSRSFFIIGNSINFYRYNELNV